MCALWLDMREISMNTTVMFVPNHVLRAFFSGYTLLQFDKLGDSSTQGQSHFNHLNQNVCCCCSINNNVIWNEYSDLTYYQRITRISSKKEGSHHHYLLTKRIFRDPMCTKTGLGEQKVNGQSPWKVLSFKKGDFCLPCKTFLGSDFFF